MYPTFSSTSKIYGIIFCYFGYNSDVSLNYHTKIVIWGLPNTRHSHRYIHKGFYETFRQLGMDVQWVMDSKNSESAITKGSLVIAVGFASKFLPIRENAHYVLHNFDINSSSKFKKHIKLQVSASGSTGSNIDDSIAKWDEKSRTLYQPWGLPEPAKDWLAPTKALGKKEYWIGAVWNNQLQQGNTKEIHKYQEALKKEGLKFRKVGGTRGFSRNGINSKKAFRLVNKSPIGATVLGNWQKTHGYIPCRAFKNVAAGGLPISNADLRSVFGDSYLFADSVEEIVAVSNEIDYKNKLELNTATKDKLQLYTYERAIQRMIDVLL
jgi:hypothetical protein